jgi:hypothetical protein
VVDEAPADVAWRCNRLGPNDVICWAKPGSSPPFEIQLRPSNVNALAYLPEDFKE